MIQVFFIAGEKKKIIMKFRWDLRTKQSQNREISAKYLRFHGEWYVRKIVADRQFLKATHG